jgi:hypothetical protein
LGLQNLVTPKIYMTPLHMIGIRAVIMSRQKILGRVINAYKGAVTARIRKAKQTKQIVWQSRYYDHIIRDNIDELQIQEDV